MCTVVFLQETNKATTGSTTSSHNDRQQDWEAAEEKTPVFHGDDEKNDLDERSILSLRR